MLGSKIAARLAGVTKRYGDIVAINLLNLEVKCGEVFGLLDLTVLGNVLAWDAGNQDRKLKF